MNDNEKIVELATKMEEVLRRLAIVEKTHELILKLAINMENMQKELGTQGMRLNKLEGEPAQQWKSLIKTVTSALVGAILMYFFNKITK